MKNIETIIKVVMAIFMLLCLADMPYGFYSLTRFLAFVGFGVLAFLAYKEELSTAMVVCIVMALLFQPFAKITLGRFLWNVIDVLTAIGLIATIVAKKRSEE